MRTPLRPIVVLISLVLMLGTVACGDDDTTDEVPTDPDALEDPDGADDDTTDDVPTDPDATDEDALGAVIQGFVFTFPLPTAAGSTLTIENLDSVPHTFSERGDAFDSGTIGGGETATITVPSEPGEYELYCQIHETMFDTFVVE